MVKPNKLGDQNFDNRLPITSYNSVYEVTLPSVTSPKLLPLVKTSHIRETLGSMSFPKFLGKKYSLIRRNKYGIEDS